jgi:predicted anti-sigma-YlaC factor YlaD
MARWWRTSACDRARQWLSLELDGELSELEQAAFARHLASCAGCRALGDEVAAFTRLIREAPMLALERPVAVAAPGRARRQLVRRAGAAAAAAAAVAAAVLGGFAVTGSAPSAPSGLAFRDAKEQRLFAKVEAQRIEPAAFVTASPTVPSFAARALV